MFTLPRIRFVHTVRGTANTLGAAFTYQSAASAARLLIASSTVSVQNTNVNTARWSFTNLPTGLVHAARPASYSATIDSSTDTGERSLVQRMPMPSSPAMRKLPGDDTVCQIGGCGCCTGFGTTVRAGMSSRSDCQVNSGSVHAVTHSRAVSSSSASVASGSMPNVD